MSDALTAEFPFQAKLVRNDSQTAMVDHMFVDWLAHHLTPAFKAIFGDEKTIPVLDNAPYHHGFDPEVGVPGSNDKKYNTQLLRMLRIEITVRCEIKVSSGKRGTREVEFSFELPAGSSSSLGETEK